MISSSTLAAEYPPATAVRARTTDLTLDDFGQHSSRQPRFDLPFHGRHDWKRTTDSNTLSMTVSVNPSDSVDSSAVFVPDGQVRTPIQAYWTRMSVLRAYAKEDGYCLNWESELDFWRFVASVPRFRKGDLVLMDNGNLRAVWTDRLGTHLGLQFLGGGMVQYVIFKRRAAAGLASRVAGRDTFDGVKRQTDAFDLASLLYK